MRKAMPALRVVARFDRKREPADRVTERDRAHRLPVGKRLPVCPLELLGVQLLFVRSVGHDECLPSPGAGDTRRHEIGGTMAG